MHIYSSQSVGFACCCYTHTWRLWQGVCTAEPPAPTHTRPAHTLNFFAGASRRALAWPLRLLYFGPFQHRKSEKSDVRFFSTGISHKYKCLLTHAKMSSTQNPLTQPLFQKINQSFSTNKNKNQISKQTHDQNVAKKQYLQLLEELHRYLHASLTVLTPTPTS